MNTGFIAKTTTALLTFVILSFIFLGGVNQALGETSSINPVADAYVQAANPTTNYGFGSSLRVDGSPDVNAFVKFQPANISGLTKATLRLYMNSAQTTGLIIRKVNDTTWTEGGIKYQAAPVPSPEIIASSGPITANTWVEFDVTSAITSNTVSLFVETTGSTAVSMGSRESANPPQLVIETSPTPSPTPLPDTTPSPSPRDPELFVYDITRNGDTYSATSNDMPDYTGTLKSVVESAMTNLNNAGGGRIVFGSGEFDLGSDYFHLKRLKYIEFVGQGIDVTFIKNVNNEIKDTEPFNSSFSTDLVLRDFTVSAGGTFRSTSDTLDFDGGNNILVERVKITGSRARGIVFDGKDLNAKAENNIVRNCIIENSPTSGVELLGAGFNRVENNVLRNNAGNGIFVTRASGTAAQPFKKSNNNIIINNTVEESGNHGINVSGGDNNQILNNTVLNNSNIVANRNGINITGNSDANSIGNIIRDNISRDTQSTKTQAYGIWLGSFAFDTVLSGNNTDFNLKGGILNQGINTQIN